ncbi:MAG: DUF1080 domain-containing protein [Bryobacterales bacterium]|nr:DUF1080 domain-containing protein [Bryobacterales bacterium]
MRQVLFVFAIIALISAVLWSGDAPAELDRDFHGDPPYLLTDGWIPLLNGADLSGWHAQEGMGENHWFTTRAIRFDAAKDAKKLFAEPAAGARMVNGPNGKTVNLATNMKHGDIELYLEFMVPKGSNSGVYLQGLYEIQVFDSWGVAKPTTTDCGSIYHRWINEKPVDGSAARVNAARRPGEWQSFHAWFRAPRFDANGKKTANARFVKVLHNGLLVQENVDLEGGTRSHMPIEEAALNPLMLQGDHGPVAYRNLYYRPLPPE